MAPKLLAARERIDGDTVLNMAVSSDTIGGSSGSPVVNAAGEILGANFDSTVLTQRNAYGYDRNVNRSVIVTTGRGDDGAARCLRDGAAGGGAGGAVSVLPPLRGEGRRGRRLSQGGVRKGRSSPIRTHPVAASRRHPSHEGEGES